MKHGVGTCVYTRFLNNKMEENKNTAPPPGYSAVDDISEFEREISSLGIEDIPVHTQLSSCLCSTVRDSLKNSTINQYYEGIFHEADSTLENNLSTALLNVPPSPEIESCKNHLEQRRGKVTLGEIMVIQYIINGGILLKQFVPTQEEDLDDNNKENKSPPSGETQWVFDHNADISAFP